MPGQTATGQTTDVDALRASVLDEVRRMIVKVIGEDYVGEEDIDLDTAFRADLDIESIEFVALGEALRVRYGEGIALAEWLAPMEVDDIIALTVRQLVDRIVDRLVATGGDGGG